MLSVPPRFLSASPFPISPWPALRCLQPVLPMGRLSWSWLGAVGVLRGMTKGSLTGGENKPDDGFLGAMDMLSVD